MSTVENRQSTYTFMHCSQKNQDIFITDADYFLIKFLISLSVAKYTENNGKWEVRKEHNRTGGIFFVP